MRKSSVLVLVLMTCFVVAQTLVGGKYAKVYIPLLWIALNIVPVIYLAAIRRLPVRNTYLLGYALLVLAPPFLQALARDFQNMAQVSFYLFPVVGCSPLRSSFGCPLKRPAP